MAIVRCYINYIYDLCAFHSRFVEKSNAKTNKFVLFYHFLSWKYALSTINYNTLTLVRNECTYFC